jgi:nitrite reductase/ring-hydroxylating ferredoxin subunit
MSTDQLVPVADLATLEREGHDVADAGGHTVALFHHEGEVYAVDNRCPHMGFPLTEGTVEDGVLTCHWHHARFELACGDTFDPWADDVQTYPVEVRDGRVYVDPDPEPDVPPATHWRNRLADGLQEDLRLVLAKAVVGLDDAGADYTVPLQTGVDFGTKYRGAGWGPGLTILTAMANVLGNLRPDDRRRALYTGLVNVADDCAGEPPRFSQYAFSNEDVEPERLKRWFRDAVAVRDSDAAERVLLTAVAERPPGEVAGILFAAATDSLYLDSGHALDFVNKALEVLDHVGWEHADSVLASTVERLTGATRSEELSSWRQPVDLAELAFSVHEDLPDLVAAGAGEEWSRPDDLLETLLSDDPDAIVDAVRAAVREGATTEQLAAAVASAAAHRVAQYATSNEFSDWNTVHHTFTYANAVHQGARRTDAPELYRGALDAALSVYLDRFLNMPAAPVPGPDDSARDPAAVRADLLDTFDEEGRVNDAARLVGEHFDAGGEPAGLVRTLGEGLLREDANFHTLQSFEAGVQQFRLARDDAERRVALTAPARYMAAHFPTRREREQTFTIAARLHRGERIHEA